MKSDAGFKYAGVIPLALFLLIAAAVVWMGDPQPVFSMDSGFYDSPVTLEISCSMKGAQIYYTTDGSIPDEQDFLYTGALELSDASDQPNRLSAETGTVLGETFIPQENVPKANVIRAVAILPGGIRSQVTSGTFFVGVDREMMCGDLPVFSLMMEEEDLFDYEKGIYILGKTYDDWLAEQPEGSEFWNSWEICSNFNNYGSEWERPITVEYLSSEGMENTVQDLGVRIKGGASRGAAQKSLRLIAREDYGEKSIKLPLFPNNLRQDGNGIVSQYKSVTLRGGTANDDYARIREPLIQRLATGLRFATLANMPCSVWINGEYWGLYTLIEEYDDHFIANHFGIDNENIIAVKNGYLENGVEADYALYEEMTDFIISNDMAEDSLYQAAGEMLDMDSFADYCALQLYVYNQDSFLLWDKNCQLWRVRTVNIDFSAYSDGRWRPILFDTDNSSGVFCNGEDYAEDNLSAALFGEEPDEFSKLAWVLRSLWENENFRRKLITAMCDVRNLFFETERTDACLQELQGFYAPLLPATIRRFGPAAKAESDPSAYIEGELDAIQRFFEGRYACFPSIMEQAFALSEPAEIHIESSDSTTGTVILNSRKLDLSQPFDGVYFPEYPIELTAVANDGATFVRWEIEGGSATDPDGETIEITAADGMKITAVFAPRDR